MKTLFHHKILPTAILPFEIIKGSPKVRNQKAAQKFQEFYKTLTPQCKDRSCSVNDFCRSLDKTFEPYCIHYAIKNEYRENRKGSIGPIIGLAPAPEGEFYILYKGQEFYFPLNEDKNKILDKFTAFHEARHLLDHIYNPKSMLLRTDKLYEQKELQTKVENLRFKFLGNLKNPINIFKFIKDANKSIDELPRDVAIDALQRIRYSLMSELVAYGDELTCLQKDKRFFEYLDMKDFLLRNCKFKSKLTYANYKLKKLISKEREELGKNCDNKKQNQRYQ